MSNPEKITPWGPEKKLKWFSEQTIKRSYREDVLHRVDVLRKLSTMNADHYGSLTLNPDQYPLYSFRVGSSPAKPNILITGGVHGYETSGVKGALLFLEKHVQDYVEHFNFVVPVCVSPWSYETINRLDPIMENPNRQFRKESKAEESFLLMNYLRKIGVEFKFHLDLHETTDSDKTFIPEEYAKNGKHIDAKDVAIPDGFYLIGITGSVRPPLEKAMIESVRKVTHIAESDERGQILDAVASADGVIHGQMDGHCSVATAADSHWGSYITEMYPDSPRYKSLPSTQVDEMCNKAQVACIRGALDFFVQGELHE